MLRGAKTLQKTPLLPCGKDLSMSYADYHVDMRGIVFEDWFENMLTANLPKETKISGSDR